MRSLKGVVREYEGADLGDTRRNARLLKIAAQLAANPKESLPKIAGDEANLEALYRFIGNPGIEWNKLLDPHRRLTAERAEQAGKVFVVHDTTTFQFAHADPDEVGYVSTGKAGFLGHVSLVVSADGERRPLGVVALQPVFRDLRSTKGRKKKQTGRETTKIKDRESLRWRAGVLESELRLSRATECIHIADREADSYSLIAQMLEAKCRFVVRVSHDRVARDSEDADWSRLKTLASTADTYFEREVPFSSRRPATAPRTAKAKPPRTARTARLRFASTTMEVKRPRYFGDDVAPSIHLNVVRVIEDAPPTGEEPVEWLLMTTEPASTADEVGAVVDAYRTRWLIEEFFKALKSGCLYEERQLESRHALLNALALFLPIATEILWLRNRAQRAPNDPFSTVITARQLAVLRALCRRPLPDAPSARDVLLAIAGLGGHLKRNGEPGWSTIRHGYERVLYAELGWAAAKSQKKL
jgi:hypothetical protein